jgi:hypothetical protein
VFQRTIESEGSKLVFLSFPIALAQFAPLAMKNSPCQLVAVLATIQLSERSPAFRLVVNISKAVDGFVDAPEFGDSLSELRWAVINPKGSHDRRRLHHTQLQRSGAPDEWSGGVALAELATLKTSSRCPPLTL